MSARRAQSPIGIFVAVARRKTLVATGWRSCGWPEVGGDFPQPWLAPPRSKSESTGPTVELSERGRPTSERGCPRSITMPTGYFIGTPKPPRKSAAPAQQQRRDAIRRDATKPQIIAASFTTGRRPLLVGWGSEHRIRVQPPPTRPTPRATPPTKPPPPPTPATADAGLPLPLQRARRPPPALRSWTLAVAHRHGALVAHSTRRAQKLAALERAHRSRRARRPLQRAAAADARPPLASAAGGRAPARRSRRRRVGAANLRRWQFALRRPLRRWAAAARVRLSRRAARAPSPPSSAAASLLQRAYGRWWDVADAAATARRAAARDGAPWAWASMRVAAVRALHRWQRVAGARVALPRLPSREGDESLPTRRDEPPRRRVTPPARRRRRRPLRAPPRNGAAVRARRHRRRAPPRRRRAVCAVVAPRCVAGRRRPKAGAPWGGAANCGCAAVRVGARTMVRRRRRRRHRRRRARRRGASDSAPAGACGVVARRARRRPYAARTGSVGAPRRRRRRRRRRPPRRARVPLRRREIARTRRTSAPAVCHGGRCAPRGAAGTAAIGV